MKYSIPLAWLPALLVLSACPEPPPEPPPPPPARVLSGVSVTCAPTTVVAGQSVQCNASATDQNGDSFDGATYTWTSRDETVANVDATGKVSTLAVSSGTVVIHVSATAGDVKRETQASIEVTPKAPTVHSTELYESETWREADNPHLVRGRIWLDDAATLTLEPGVVVRFAPNAELSAAFGSIQARGTQTAPILLQAESGSARGSWYGLVFSTPNLTSRLEHVTVSGCGAPAGEGACISVRSEAKPVLRDVSVRDSGSAGVVFTGAGSAFGTDSARLSVSNSAGYAVRMAANEVDSFPVGGTFTDNSPNAVELSGDVSRTQTWPANPGIPFFIPGNMNVGNPNSVVTLTLSAGTQLRFGANTQLVVGFSNPFQSILNVEGTADAPVLFTANADSPTLGHWRGVHIITAPSVGRISHAIFEYAGAPADSSAALEGDGNLNIYDGGAVDYVLTDVVARRGKAAGIKMIELAGFGEGSARVTSTENGSYPLTIDALFVGTIPTGGVWTGNAQDMVRVSSNFSLTKTQTWPNLGIPYLITEVLHVGSADKATLTLLPGTELRFEAGKALVMGYSANSPGALIAQGTSTEPIRFLPAAQPATAGYWKGLHFWQADGSRLDHVLVTHAGTFDENNAAEGVLGPANVVVHRELGPFITNSTFRDAIKNPICVSSGVLAGSTRVDTQFFNAEYNNDGTNNPAPNEQCFYDI